MKELAVIEPEPDGSKDYADFLSEFELQKIAAEKNKIPGTDELMELGLEYNKVSAGINYLTEDKQLIGNKIKKYMRDNETTILDFGKEGRISFNRRLYVNVGK
jgi:hypothetical protein